MSEEIRKPRQRSAEEAFAALARLCSRAEKSSGDAMRLMRTWGVPEADRPKVLQQLQEQRYIDDERFAGAFVRDKLSFSGWGPYKIRTALAAKGIDRRIIDRALAGCGSDDMPARLERALSRKAASIPAGDPFQRRARLMRYGLSLGYDYESVRDCVEHLIAFRD